MKIFQFTIPRQNVKSEDHSENGKTLFIYIKSPHNFKQGLQPTNRHTGRKGKCINFQMDKVIFRSQATSSFFQLLVWLFSCIEYTYIYRIILTFVLYKWYFPSLTHFLINLLTCQGTMHPFLSQKGVQKIACFVRVLNIP